MKNNSLSHHVTCGIWTQSPARLCRPPHVWFALLPLLLPPHSPKIPWPGVCGRRAVMEHCGHPASGQGRGYQRRAPGSCPSKVCFQEMEEAGLLPYFCLFFFRITIHIPERLCPCLNSLIFLVFTSHSLISSFTLPCQCNVKPFRASVYLLNETSSE